MCVMDVFAAQGTKAETVGAATAEATTTRALNIAGIAGVFFLPLRLGLGLSEPASLLASLAMLSAFAALAPVAGAALAEWGLTHSFPNLQ